MTPVFDAKRPDLRRAWPSRTACLFLLGQLSFTLACAGDDTRPSSSASAVGSRDRASNDVGGALPDGGSPRPTLDVQLLLRNDDGEPIVGRPVVAVDSRDKHLEVMTDETGSLFFMGLSPPYDVAVAPAPSGSVVTPVVFVGLTRPDPRIVVSERLEPAAPSPVRRLHVEVAAPPCPVAGESCWVVATSTSSSGTGHGAAWYGAESTQVVVDLTHVASSGPGSSSEAALLAEPTEVHVLAGEELGSGFWYARASAPTDGNLGPLTLDLVEATEPAVFATRPPDTERFWNWRLEAWLAMPDGGRLLLRRAWWPSFAARVPLLPGALLEVRASAETSDDDHSPMGARRVAEVWSGALPLATPNVVLEAPRTAVSTRAGTNVSRRGPGIGWTGPDGVSTVVLVDLQRGLQRFRLVTAEREVSLRRLEALGIPRPDPGQHALDIETQVHGTVDGVADVTAPIEPLPSSLDQREPGASTYTRFGFVVTP
ncbi:hypothetical protein [Labilithrix luteola]|nr:hypothetical protein [Labilithrix luteola]